MDTVTQSYAEDFVEMLTVDIRLGILAEQILTLVVVKLVAQLAEGGLACGRIVRVSRSELCQAAGKASPFPQRQIESTMKQLASAIVATRKGNDVFRTVLVERCECVRIGDDLQLAVVVSDSVVAMLNQEWRSRLH